MIDVGTGCVSSQTNTTMRLLAFFTSIVTLVTASKESSSLSPTSASLSSLREWFVSRGGEMNRLDLEGSERDVRLISTSDVDKGALILKVPYDIVISTVTIDKGINAIKSRKIRRAFRKLKRAENMKFVLFCMWEISKGTKSEWYPFFNVLSMQDDINLPRRFTKEELQELQDDLAAEEALRLRNELIESFGTYRSSVEAIFGSYRSPAKVEHWTSLETFMKWEATLNSVSLMIRGERILVPIANFVKYAYDPVPRESNAGDHFLHYHRQTETTFDIYADRRTPAGTPIFEDYGDNSNHVYLQHHGFVPDVNPFDCVRVAIPFRDPNEPHVRGQSTRLKMLANIADVTDLLRRDPMWCISPRKPLRDPMLYYLRVLEMDEDTLDSCREKIHGTAGNDAKMAALRCFHADRAIDDRVYDRMRRILRRMLLSFPTSIEEDEEMLRNTMQNQMTANERIAIKYRISRKRLVMSLNTVLERPARGDRCEWEKQDDLTFLKDELNHWIGTKGLATQRVVANLNPGRRLGAMATKTMTRGEVFVTLPVPLIMDHRSASSPESDLSFVIRELRELYPPGDDYHNLLFHLIYERYKMERRSYWWQYLATLPNIEDLHVPLFFSEQEINRLEGSHVLRIVRRHREDVREKFVSIKTRVFDIYERYFDEDVFTYENYMWATAVLSSRATWWDDGPHLVPLVDLVKCANEYVFVEEEEEDHEFDPRPLVTETMDGTVTIRLSASVEAGDYVERDCELPNWQLFLRHGIIAPNVPSFKSINPYDCVQMSFALDEENDRYALLERELQRRGMYSTRLNVCLSPYHAIPPELWMFVRVMYELDEADVIGARAKLLEECEAHLDAFPTTIHDDYALLTRGRKDNVVEGESDEYREDGEAGTPSTRLNHHERIALHLVFEEKKTLLALMESLQQEIAGLRGRSSYGEL